MDSILGYLSVWCRYVKEWWRADWIFDILQYLDTLCAALFESTLHIQDLYFFHGVSPLPFSIGEDRKVGDRPRSWPRCAFGRKNKRLS